MFVKIKESVEEKLRKLCAGLSPEKRVPAIVMLAALFAIGNFYMIFRAIHDIGREDVRPEIIEIPLNLSQAIEVYSNTCRDDKAKAVAKNDPNNTGKRKPP